MEWSSRGCVNSSARCLSRHCLASTTCVGVRRRVACVGIVEAAGPVRHAREHRRSSAKALFAWMVDAGWVSIRRTKTNDDELRTHAICLIKTSDTHISGPSYCSCSSQCTPVGSGRAKRRRCPVGNTHRNRKRHKRTGYNSGFYRNARTHVLYKSIEPRILLVY